MVEIVAHLKLGSWMATADGGQDKVWQALPSVLISGKVDGKYLASDADC